MTREQYEVAIKAITETTTELLKAAKTSEEAVNIMKGQNSQIEAVTKAYTATTKLQNFVDQYGFGISKEKLAVKAYRQLRAEGHDCYIINDRYIGVDGQEYQLIKSRKERRWIVKEF